MQCNECDICEHQYSCTCPDSLVRLTICKHIHLLLRKISAESNHQQQSNKITRTDNRIQSKTLLLEEVANKSQITSNNTVNNNIHKLLSIVQKNSGDQDIIKRVNTPVSRAIQVAQLAQPKSMEYKNKTPVTKNISPQKPFQSQRKRKRMSTVKLAKPSVTSKLQTWQSLLTNDDTLTKAVPGDYRFCMLLQELLSIFQHGLLHKVIALLHICA